MICGSELVAVLVGVAAVDDVGAVASSGVLDQVEEESSAHGVVVVGEAERGVEEGAGAGRVRPSSSTATRPPPTGTSC